MLASLENQQKQELKKGSKAERVLGNIYLGQIKEPAIINRVRPTLADFLMIPSIQRAKYRIKINKKETLLAPII